MENKSDELLDKSNVEKFIMGAISKYTKSNRIIDSIFWRSVIVTLLEKYGIKDEFNKALKEQQSEVKKV